MKRILIQNGTLYDGLGGQPYQADLLVQDGRIAQIAPGITEPADQVIDATGKVVTPGFVDIHRHHDAKPLNDPHFGEVELAQGITTAVARQLRHQHDPPAGIGRGGKGVLFL